MKTNELIEKIEEEQMKISNAMLDVFKEHGWIIDKSNSDIKAETIDGYKMTIEDGTCPDIVEALIHIYGQGGKVFEGRLETPEEVNLLMKMLGFEKEETS